MRKVFRLPDPGEGLTDAEIAEWLVSPGDTVEVNQPIIEVETAKSLVELPSPWDGVVIELLAEEGDTVEVGAPIIAIDVEGDVEPDEDNDDEESGAVLVGYGTRRPRPAALPEPEVVDTHVLAKPPVRALARELAVDLSAVRGTGPGGIVTRDDVLDFSDRARSASLALHPVDRVPEADEVAPGGEGAIQAGERHAGDRHAGDRHAGDEYEGEDPWLLGGRVSPDGRRTRVPVRSVRRRTAEAMVASAFTAPHVSVTHTVDMTRTMELLERLKASREFRDLRLTPLLFVMKALLLAVRRHPEINASWDEEAQEIVYKHYINLGIAASTPRGLIVPNIKNAHRMGLKDLAASLSYLTETARAGKTSLEEMSDGTITISNVGAFGIDDGTPILNPGESAILAFGAIRDQPWIRGGGIVPAKIATFTLSFDHRLVDGELGALVLRDVATVLEDPGHGLVWS